MKILVNPILRLENSFVNSTLDDRTYFINDYYTNMHHVFIHNYVNYVSKMKSTNYVDTDSVFTILEQILNGSFNASVPYYQEYAAWEISSYQPYDNDKNKKYIKFLDTNYQNFYTLDQLHASFKTTPISSYKIEHNTWSLFDTEYDYNKLIMELNKYQDFIVSWTRFTLLNGREIDRIVDFKQSINQICNIEALLLGFDAYAVKEKKAILEELKDHIDKISSDFYVNASISKKISPHIFMTNFINEKFDTIDNFSPWYQDEDEDEGGFSSDSINVNQDEDQTDFPTYIFRNKTAFTLFHTIASKMQKHVQFSFLFRQMSEKQTQTLSLLITF